jgi:hypothetical protein
MNSKHHNTYDVQQQGSSGGGSATLPSTGSAVAIDAELSGGTLISTHVRDESHDKIRIDLDNAVLISDSNARALSVSAEDSESFWGALTHKSRSRPAARRPGGEASGRPGEPRRLN